MIEENEKVCEKLLISAEEAASILDIALATFWRFHSSGRVPLPIKLGRRTLWRKQELFDWVATGCPNRQKWENIKNNGKRT
ncbi:MAG: hypothetical protein ABIH42_02825 [Planctomycetota bacterium]